MQSDVSIKSSLLIIIGSIFFLVIVFKGFSYLSLSGEEKSRDTEAYVCAIDVVESHLKAPSTADFCGFDEARVTDLGNNKYKVTGYVDAQNSFGAVVREYFYVTLTLTKNGYSDAYCSIN